MGKRYHVNTYCWALYGESFRLSFLGVVQLWKTCTTPERAANPQDCQIILLPATTPHSMHSYPFSQLGVRNLADEAENECLITKPSHSHSNLKAGGIPHLQGFIYRSLLDRSSIKTVRQWFPVRGIEDAYHGRDCWGHILTCTDLESWLGWRRVEVSYKEGIGAGRDW